VAGQILGRAARLRAPRVGLTATALSRHATFMSHDVLEPSRAGELVAPEAVVGVPAEPDRLAASEAALAVQAGLRAAFPDRPALAVVLTSDPRGAVSPTEPCAPSQAGEPPAIYTGSHGGPAAALPTLLELALAQGAPVCALLEPIPRPPEAGWLRALLDPVLHGGVDLVAPAYARGRFDGVLVTGVVYPLTRALFGHRLRQPLGPEIVVSRRLAELLLHDDGWRTDPIHAGQDLWVITKAIVRECRMAQVFLGPRPVPPAQPVDVSAALARVLGTVFHEMELHAARWQRVRGSRPVPTFGDDHGVPDGPPPAPGPLVSAFALGWQDLRRIWSAVLPPQTLLALQRIPRDPADAFRIPDALWARVVYDLAMGWRLKVMDREQLLRSMTPLYLGWVASFVNEVAGLAAPAAEARVERLCEVFEAEKPYLISRWRWPDRFSP
jgi:glucosylglycerate synthase